MSSKPPHGTPTPLANHEPPDLPPLTFDIDDVTGHYPIGLLKEKANAGKFSENPLEHPDLFDDEPDGSAEGADASERRGIGLTIPQAGQMSPALMLVTSLFVGSVLAMFAVAVVLVLMAMLGV